MKADTAFDDIAFGGVAFTSGTFQVMAVAEPSSLVLAGLAEVAGLARARRRAGRPAVSPVGPGDERGPAARAAAGESPAGPAV